MKYERKKRHWAGLMAAVLLIAAALFAGCAEKNDGDEPQNDGGESQKTVEKPKDPWLNLSEEETCGSNGYQWIDPESEEHLMNYWAFDEEFALLRVREGGSDQEKETIGLGIGHEMDADDDGYEGCVRVQAEDLAALSWMTVEYDYWDDVHQVVLTDLRKKEVWEGTEATVRVVQYLAVTGTQWRTGRGISVGDTTERLMEAYPEIQAQTDYYFYGNADEDGEETGVANHDGCWMFLPEGSNRSILFLTEGDTIVQIDLGDGMDGQIWSPAWTGTAPEK